MAKITYYLGAGASYHSCPILNQQAELMIALAREELHQSFISQVTFNGPIDSPYYRFIKSEFEMLKTEKEQILWYIGYFGSRALEFNTIDTYARKLFLTKQSEELSFLKMAVSVFFDLWENFRESRYATLSEKQFRSIDQRYTALFSILLENDNNKIQLNENFRFISWNYDLQLENTFKSFLVKDEVESLDHLNDNYFRFKEENNSSLKNNVFHLNGHRGFFLDKKKGGFELNVANDFNDYWNNVQGLYESTKRGTADFDQYIKYAWEHNMESDFYKNIYKVLDETDILIIIGYSFPPFNRAIDQALFAKLNVRKIKRIIYQDPTANEQIIESLFEFPHQIKSKIEIINQENSLTWFNLPNEHFITQKKPNSSSISIHKITRS